jgi:hypothetical protein
MTLTDEQRKAVNALREAHSMMRLMDTHRSLLMGLCLKLGVPRSQVDSVLRPPRDD